MTNTEMLAQRYIEAFPTAERDYFQCVAFLRAAGLPDPQAHTLADSIFFEGADDAPAR